MGLTHSQTAGCFSEPSECPGLRIRSGIHKGLEFVMVLLVPPGAIRNPLIAASLLVTLLLAMTREHRGEWSEPNLAVSAGDWGFCALGKGSSVCVWGKLWSGGGG